MQKYFLTLIIILLSFCFFSAHAQTYVNREWVKVQGTPDSIDWSASTYLWGQVITTANTVTVGQQANILTTSYAQGEGEVLWEAEWDGPQSGADYGAAIVADEHSGDIYVAGASHYSTDSTLDIVLLKYDWDGNLLWQINYSGSGINNYPVAMDMDGHGYVYVTGATEGLNTDLDFVTLKFDQDGQLEWDATYDYNGGVDIAASINVCEDGESVAVTGGSETSNGVWDYTTVLYDIQGNQVAVDREPSDDADIRKPMDLVRDADKNYFITGVEHNNSTYDIKLIKLDSTLAPQWVEVYNSGSNEGSNALHIDDDGNLYIGGWIEEGPGYQHFLILKHDNNGAFQWSRTLIPDETKTIAEVTDLKVVDETINIIGHVTDGYESDIVTGQLCLDGELDWLTSWEGVGGSIDYPSSVQHVGNSVYVSGRTMTPGGMQWVTLKYSFHDRETTTVTDTAGFSYVGNELIIQFDPTVMVDSVINNREITFGYLTDFVEDSISIARGGDTVKLHHFWTTLIVEFPASVEEQVADTLLTNNLWPGIYYAELNLVGEFGDIPNDPYFVYQTGLESYPDIDIQMDRAWDVYHGSPSVRAGVFDTGVQWSHEAFGDGTYAGSKINGGWDFVDHTHISNSPNSGDSFGHGTRVAGIIGALRNNSEGIAGIAGGDAAVNNPGASLFAFRVGDHSGPCLDKLAEAIVAGATQVPDGYGLHVLNFSGYFPYSYLDMDDRSTLYEAMKTVHQNDVVFVCIRGNEGDTRIDKPAVTSPRERRISVGASRLGPHPLGARADFSNYGREMDLIAPGVESLVYTTGLNNTYLHREGTSFAASHVSGVAALMISYILDHPAPNPLHPEDVQFLLNRYTTSPDGYTQGVYYDEIGWGRLNAGKVMEHLIHPNYLIKHFQGSASVSGNATLIVSMRQIKLSRPVQGLPADEEYFADVYEVELVVNHSTGSYSIENFWRRTNSSNLLGNSQDIDPNYFDVSMHDVTNTGATMRGYIYHLLEDDNGNPLDHWIPFDLNGTAEFGYSLHLHDPSASLGESVTRSGVVELYPNPGESAQYLRFFTDKPARAYVKLVDITGRTVKPEGQLSRKDS